jgi:hypothetical protein
MAVINKFYGINVEPQPMAEIASDFNVTKSRIKQIHDKAIRKMRKRHDEFGVLIWWQDAKPETYYLRMKRKTAAKRRRIGILDVCPSGRR